MEMLKVGLLTIAGILSGRCFPIRIRTEAAAVPGTLDTRAFIPVDARLLVREKIDAVLAKWRDRVIAVVDQSSAYATAGVKESVPSGRGVT